MEVRSQASRYSRECDLSHDNTPRPRGFPFPSFRWKFLTRGVVERVVRKLCTVVHLVQQVAVTAGRPSGRPPSAVSKWSALLFGGHGRCPWLLASSLGCTPGMPPARRLRVTFT